MRIARRTEIDIDAQLAPGDMAVDGQFMGLRHARIDQIADRFICELPQLIRRETGVQLSEVIKYHLRLRHRGNDLPLLR